MRPRTQPECTTSSDLEKELRFGPDGDVTGVDVSGLPDSCSGREVGVLIETVSGEVVEVYTTAEDGTAELTLPDPVAPDEIADLVLRLYRSPDGS
jgi:hypothetical protein